MADERENVRPPEKTLTPGAKPDAKLVAPIPSQKDVPIGFGTISPEMERYRAMIAKDPGSRVFAALAELYRKAGMLDEAVRLCLDGTKAHPKYMSGRVALARAYFDKGMIKEAKEEVRTVVSITPDNILANKILGEIQLLEGDAGEAAESFMKVLALAPDDAEAKEKLLEAQKGPKKRQVPRDKKEEILEGEILEDLAEGETSEIIEDVMPLEDDEEILEEEGREPALRGGPSTDKPLESASLEIPLEDDGSLDDLFSDEYADNEPGSERIREPGADVDAGGPGDEWGLGEARGDEARPETSVGYAPDDETEIGSDRQTQDADIDIEGDQELVDEFGILDEEEGDITVEGLDNGRGSTTGVSAGSPVEKPSLEPREDEESPPHLIERAPEGQGDESDTQGITITTETIADIYVKQGYYDKALSVYEDLLGVYPKRDSLKQKIAFIKNKMRGMAPDDKNGGMIPIDGEDKTVTGVVTEVADNQRLQNNVESLNRWLLSIRKLRRF